MARRKRSESNDPKRVVDTDLTPQQEADLVTWHTHTTDRFRCPLCHMWANVDNLVDAPYELEAALQRYGGSFPGYMEKGKNLVRRGYIQLFDEPPETVQRLAAQMIPIVDRLRTALLELSEGDIAEPPVKYQDRIPDYLPPGIPETTKRTTHDDEYEDEFDNAWDDLEPRGEELLRIEQQARRNVEKRHSEPQLTEAEKLAKNKAMILERLKAREQQQLEGKSEQKALPSGKKQNQITGKSEQKALQPPRE